ncbi:MAG: hypothetical protein WA865_06235 [Spirulinaceae cyanobacterium]
MSQAAILNIEDEYSSIRLHSQEILFPEKSQDNYLYEFTESVVKLLETIKELKKLIRKNLEIKRI